MTYPPADLGRPEGEARRDVHNSNVDQDAAEAGRCGTLNLHTGRVCQRPALHPGSCAFGPPHNPDRPG